MTEYDSELIIIDDEEDVRHSLKQMFSIAGFFVLAFGNAIEALEHISKNFEGVIISDVRMPDMDGIEFLKQVRKLDKLLPLVLITGHGDVKLAVEALKLGATDFLEKPFDPQELLKLVKLLQFHRQETVVKANIAAHHSLKEMTEDYEKNRILYSLKQHHGSIVSVMTDLKLPRRTLNEKMVKYKINRNKFLL